MINNKVKYKSLQLSDLIQGLKGEIELIHGDPYSEVSSIEYKSKDVYSKSLFVAIEGFMNDGHNYVRDAVERGVSAIVISQDRLSQFLDLRDTEIAILASANTRRSLSQISALFFQNPSEKIPVIGITGTNGKTSITYMLESILNIYGLYTGIIGTVCYRWKNKVFNASNTTPESKDLHEIISNMVYDGIDVVIMEVSSHGLELSRVDNINFDYAVFTNLTRDHLDFHKTYEDYFNSKRKIFQILEFSSKMKKAGVINYDDDYGRLILNKKKGYSFPIISIGISEMADYRVRMESIQNSIDGISYILEKPVKRFKMNLSVPGRFHVYNSLCAFAVAHHMGIPLEIIRHGLSNIRSIPGRFDRIRSGLGFDVIVDYAHTDDALYRLLQSVRELHPQRLITLFGCGGNRDKTKRPIMGSVAASNSDWVIITSDNPRDENPLDIITDIVTGIDTKNYEIIPDREEAIMKAINMANKDDIIVVAGKGHEDYQLIEGRRIHFNDHEIVRKYIAKR